MLWTLVAILLALWLVGWLAFEAAGGLVHILLVVAAIIVAWQLLTRRRTV